MFTKEMSVMLIHKAIGISMYKKGLLTGKEYFKYSISYTVMHIFLFKISSININHEIQKEMQRFWKTKYI